MPDWAFSLPHRSLILVISGLGEFRAIFASWSDKLFGDEQLLIPVKLTTESGNVTSQYSAVDQNY
jgi:hypothetical protein